MKARLASTLVLLPVAVGLWLLTLSGLGRYGASPSVKTAKAAMEGRMNLGVTPPMGLHPGLTLPQPNPGLHREGSPTNAASVAKTTLFPVTGAATHRAPAKRPWDPAFLTSLRNASKRDSIQFELTDGRTTVGTIDRLERLGDGVRYVAGRLVQPEAGRFFFQKQTMPGVAGAFVGVVEFPDSAKAYRIEPTGLDGASELVERPLSEVVCLKLARPDANHPVVFEEIPPLNPGEFPDVPIPGHQQGIVVLESRPGAAAVIYLDLQGGVTAAWGGIAYQRSSFDNLQIRDLWRRVAEDFLPFAINVTTDLRAFQKAPAYSRQRVIITPTDTAASGAGGVAYVGSFNWTEDTPCWVFETATPKDCAQACTHEAGHTLGLVHNGRVVNGVHMEYYAGHGSGETGWAPIMGVAYYQNVTQWSRGEYADANNTQPQLEIIATQNNVDFRADDTGATLAAARYLEVEANGAASAQGVIETTGDTDAFRFTTSGGEISLRADPAGLSPNLAIELGLYDDNNTLRLIDHPQTTLSASLSTNLPNGTYTVRVGGAGRNNPLTDGFSPYGSVGYYAITGLVANAKAPDRFVIPENTPNGTIVGVLRASAPNGAPLTFTITSGNISNTFALDNSGTLRVANQATLNYEALARTTQFPVQFELFVDVANGWDASLSETRRRVVVGVTNINESPTITRFTTPVSWRLTTGGVVPMTNLWQTVFFQTDDRDFAVSVVEHTPPGTPIARFTGTDPDYYTLLAYSIFAGNSNGMFKIDSESGEISVAGDPIAAAQNVYQLSVVLSDQTPPVPLMVTSMVTLTVQLPYSVGSIAYAAYTNIAGTLVSALTNHSRFPTDPAFEDQAPIFERNSNEKGGFGAVMRGYLLPPETGSYTFWVASQDNSELWLGSSTNPASMTRIAHISGEGNRTEPHEWTKFPSQQAAPVALAAGYAYYIEARLKAGTATNYLGVAWECADTGRTREIIPGQYLAPYVMNYVPHPVGFAGYLHEDAFAGTQVGTVAVTDVSEPGAHSLAITSGNEDGLFSLDSATGTIRLISDVALRAANRTNYSLTVQATDNGTPPLSDVATVTIDVVPSQQIVASSVRQEIWINIPGTAVADLTSNTRYPKWPDRLRALSGFDSGLANVIQFGTTNGLFVPGFQGTLYVGNAYGSRIRAYLTPTNTGLYSFFIASRDESQLWFGDATNPATANIIAYLPGGATDYHEWNRYASQQSGAQWLVAGNRYYIESVHKSAGPGPLFNLFPGSLSDHVSVAWTGPGIAGTNVIAGSFLTPVDIEYPPALADGSVKLPSTATNGTLVTTFHGTDSPADTLVYRIADGNVGGTFGLDATSGNLTVADNTLFANNARSNFNLAIQVQDSGYGGLYPLRTTEAALNVQIVDTTRPVTWTGAGNNGNWSLTENWTPDLPGETSKLVFSGVAQQTNRNDLLTTIGPVAINSSGFYIEGNPLILNGGLSNRGNNGWAINSILGADQTFTNHSGTLAVTRPVNNNSHNLAAMVTGTLRLDAEVSGAGGLFKSGPGRLVLTAGNSYTGPTVVSAGTLVLRNSGALAASTLVEVQAGSVLDVRGVAGGFTVPANQTIRGAGTILGSMTVEGILSPTPDLPPIPYFSTHRPILTISNQLILAGTTMLQITKYAPQATEGSVRVAGALRLGGSLIVSNSSIPIVFGDTFKLFNATNLTGEFASMRLPTLANGLDWDVSQLSVDGTLRVGAFPPRITMLGSSGTGMAIRFQTAAGVNYALESTATLAQPSSWTNVATYPGTGGWRTIAIQISPAIPQRFLRIRTY